MKCKSVELRRIGSYLLRDSRSKSVLPGLKSALDDPDVEVRYNAVMGLAEYANDRTGHAPTMKEYRADEQKYLDYWRNKDLR